MLPFFVAAPTEWGCGEREPLGQGDAVAHFRLVALPLIATSTLTTALLLIVANRMLPSRSSLSVPTIAGFALLAAALGG